MACYYIVISSTHLSNGHFRNIKGVFRGPLNKNGNKTLDYAEKEKTIAKALEDLKANFYCELCDKQYYKHQEFDNHINSYDHAHKQRLKELKHREYARNVASKCRRDEKKQEKALKRLHKLAELRKEAVCAPGSGPMFKSTTVAVVENANQNQQNIFTVDRSKAGDSEYLVNQSTANTEEACSISGQISETGNKRPEYVKTRNQIHGVHRQKIPVSFSFSKKTSVKLESSAAVFYENNEEGSAIGKYDSKCRIVSGLSGLQSMSSTETSTQSEENCTCVIPSIEQSNGSTDSTLVRTSNNVHEKEEENEPDNITVPHSLPPYSDVADASYLNLQTNEGQSLTTGMLTDIDEPRRSICAMQAENTSSSKGDEELPILEYNSQEKESIGPADVSAGDIAREGITELLQTTLEEKHCASPKSEMNGCSRSYRDFIPVLSKDGTTILQWPSEMLTFTCTEPSISYSCNPLCFDFKSSKPRECLASNKTEHSSEAQVPMDDIKPQEDPCNRLIVNNIDIDDEVISSCTTDFKVSTVSGNNKHRLQNERYNSDIAVLSDVSLCHNVPKNSDIYCLARLSLKHKHCKTHTKEIIGKKHTSDTFSRHIRDISCHKKRKRRRKLSRYSHRESHRKDCRHFHKYEDGYASCNDLQSCSRQSEEQESLHQIQLESTNECQPLQQCCCIFSRGCQKESEPDVISKCSCVNPNFGMPSDRNGANFETFPNESKTNPCKESPPQQLLLNSNNCILTDSESSNKSEQCVTDNINSISDSKSSNPPGPEKSSNTSNSSKRRTDFVNDDSDESPVKQKRPSRKHIFCITYPELDNKPKRKRRRKRSKPHPFNGEHSSSKMDDIAVTNVLVKDIVEDTRTLKGDTSKHQMLQISNAEKLGQLQNNVMTDNQASSSDGSLTLGFTKLVSGQSSDEEMYTQMFTRCDYPPSSTLSVKTEEAENNNEYASSHGRTDDHSIEILHTNTENSHENSNHFYVKPVHMKFHHNINDKCSSWAQQNREVRNCQQTLELKGPHINNHAFSIKHQGSSPLWLPDNTMIFIPEDDEKYRSLQIHTCQQIAHQIAHQHMMSNSLKFAFTGTGAQPCASVLQPLHVQQAIASTSLTTIHHHSLLQQPAAVFTGKFLQPHQQFLSQVPTITRAPLSHFSLASGICSGSHPGFVGTPHLSVIPAAALHTGSLPFPPLPNPSLFTPLVQQHATLVPLHQLF
ncbi:zinc finger protein 804A [Protopterus annectens]|uniref:zinc finger protein 804A n=1 Tax=Protopterus annectens TaxID=7888 RepID=UPI001CF9A7F9|nr:zinc finger protein 804A [Protopterus annectens]